MDVRVREQILPGIGHRYEVLLDQHRVVVVVQRNGRRELSIDDGTDPATAASLSQEQAIALAAILTGARFSIDTSADSAVEADEVDVRTVTVGTRSPAVGRTAGDIPFPPGVDAEVLAVIRDETPELVEDETSARVSVGDRLVVATRREHLELVLHHLAGDGT